jgi:cyclase
MLKKRIIPCLDIRDGRTVKGVNFVDISDAGDPVSLAKAYAKQGADELVFLDITATVEGRRTFARLVERIAMEIDIPFTVGGGINTTEDVSLLLRAGADKVSINTAAVLNPNLINELAAAFGSQCVVVAIDTNFINGEWIVYTHGGRKPTEIKTLEWAREVEKRGAGEILLTSMVHDGTRNGFAIDLTKAAGETVNIPVIASGGAGSATHFKEVFDQANADAALAASVFHFGDIPIRELKDFLKTEGLPIR